MARLVTAVLALSFLFIGYPGHLASSPRIALHEEPAGSGKPEDQGQQHAPLAVRGGTSDESPALLSVDVAVDEEFPELAGDSWESDLDDLLEAANALLSPVGVQLAAESVQQWHSDDAIPAISSQLISAERQPNRAPSNIFLAITGQKTAPHDGYVWESQTRAITRFYPERRERSASVIVHETGHLLGAEHHEDDDECTGHGCFMDRAGYAHATEWCNHHLQEIQEFIAWNLGTLET
jgi:hypothetical protein